jgi:hypothetical protein
LIGSEPRTVEAVVTHCANPKCRMGREKGVPAAVERQSIVEAADRLWPVTTLADGRKVLKFCGLSCCHDYQRDQAKLPESQRDPDIGRIVCTRCGSEEFHGTHGLAGERDEFCSVKCVSQLALVYRARDRQAAEMPNRSPGARRRDDLPASKDAVDLVATYNKEYSDVVRAGKAVLWDFFRPDIHTIFEWRIELDCGCVRQAVTGGDDSKSPEHLLAASAGYVHLDSSLKLPPGQRVCFCHQGHYGPVRDIVEWVDRDSKVVVPEPMVIEGKEIGFEPFTTWYVLLECGHVETTGTNPDWTPEDGSALRGYKRPRRELERSFREIYADDEHHLAYMLRLIDENWPEPAPFTNCNACRYSRYVVAYQPVGLISPPPKPPRQPRPKKSREEILRGQVTRTERELARLRRELKAATPPRLAEQSDPEG